MSVAGTVAAPARAPLVVRRTISFQPRRPAKVASVTASRWAPSAGRSAGGTRYQAARRITESPAWPGRKAATWLTGTTGTRRPSTVTWSPSARARTSSRA